jgi:monoglucosyldiacylglycerol epimerase
MPDWIPLAWGPFQRLILQGAALFVVATFVFDATHFGLHLCLRSRSRWLRWLASPHQAHHDFFDSLLRYHDEAVVPNLLHHVIPEYTTQILVCAMAFTVLDLMPVIIVMAIFTVLFVSVLILKGKDHSHVPFAIIPVPRGTMFVGAPYHVMHHVYPESHMSSFTTLFDLLMGTACQIRGRRVAMTGASGAFGSAMRDLLERAGAVVVPLKFGADWTYEDYSKTDCALAEADILVLAHGVKGEQAMQANCTSFLAMIDRFRSLTQHRQVPVEVWAVGSEIECHPAFGDSNLRSYAQWKRAYAQMGAQLMVDRGLLYRHIVPSAFLSEMGPGVISGRTAATIALWLIRRGFRYVPVTYTGIAFVNFIPFFLRGMLAGSLVSRRPRFLPDFAALCWAFFSATRRGQEPNVRSPVTATRVLKAHPPHRGLQKPHQPQFDAPGDRQEFVHRAPEVLRPPSTRKLVQPFFRRLT